MSASNQTSQPQPPEQPKGETIINPFHDMVSMLRQALQQIGPLAPDAAEPAADQRFGRYIDAHLLAQQGLIVQRCDMVAKENYENYRATTVMQRSLALIEKTRARILKSREFAAKMALEKLKALNHSSQPDRTEARDFLQKELSGGERPAKELLALANSLGLTNRTIYRAKSELGIASQQRDRTWHWSLPDSEFRTQNSAPSAVDMQDPVVSVDSEESTLPQTPDSDCQIFGNLNEKSGNLNSRAVSRPETQEIPVSPALQSQK